MGVATVRCQAHTQHVRSRRVPPVLRPDPWFGPACGLFFTVASGALKPFPSHSVAANATDPRCTCGKPPRRSDHPLPSVIPCARRREEQDDLGRRSRVRGTMVSVVID